MRTFNTLLSLLLILLIAAPPVQASGGSDETNSDETIGENGLLPAGFVFTPPAESEINFGNDPPLPRKPVDKDARIVAVVFSVAQHKPMRKAFPDVEQIDLMPVAGRPMIERVIEGLKTSHYVDRIIVVGDEHLQQHLPFGDDPMITFLVDYGDAAENVKHGISQIARDDLVLLLPSDLVLINGDAIDPLVDHARKNPDIDVFFPLVQRAHTEGTPAEGQLFIPFKEGPLTAGHVELVRPALFVDNADDVKNEKKTFYDVYSIRTDALGIVRFLGLVLSVKFVVHQLSPGDIVRQIYVKYHVRAQGLISDDTRLVTDVYSTDVLPAIEALIVQDENPDAAQVASMSAPTS